MRLLSGDLIQVHELTLLFRLGVSLLCGALIGIERESRDKPAGVSTHCFVVAGAAMFTSLSVAMDAASPARIAAQVVSGVGFLGAGIILKRDDGGIANLTTAASVWFAAALGMTIGFGWYLSALAGTVFALLVTRIPHVSSWRRARDE